jgi:hypothetical protein
MPFLQTSWDGHPAFSEQGLGQGPTEPTGAEANSVDDPAAQNRSTGWPSHPQRPPGSTHAAPATATTHVPLPSQPVAPVNPQRWREGHSESFLQLAPCWEL